MRGVILADKQMATFAQQWQGCIREGGRGGGFDQGTPAPRVSNAKTEEILFFLPKGECSSEVIKITNLEFGPETFSLAVDCPTN
jgi:hypothetical protein